MNETHSNWKHAKTVLDGDPFQINGIDIWTVDWKDTKCTIQVTDPIYGQLFTFKIYEIGAGSTTVRFAAGEFSNGVWGIYEEMVSLDNRNQ